MTPLGEVLKEARRRGVWDASNVLFFLLLVLVPEVFLVSKNSLSCIIMFHVLLYLHVTIQ